MRTLPAAKFLFAMPAMLDDSPQPFRFPAIITASFDGARISSNGGVMLAAAEHLAWVVCAGGGIVVMGRPLQLLRTYYCSKSGNIIPVRG